MKPETDKVFSGLIQQNKGIIFKICNSYCYHKDDREDLAQEIVYQLWKSWGSYDERYKFSTWMYRVALNVAISFYRKEKKTENTVPLGDRPIEAEDDSAESRERELNLLKLQGFIKELKELDRALMILYLEEKSHREIAEIMGISESNVSTKVARIKEKLKQKFQTANS